MAQLRTTNIRVGLLLLIGLAIIAFAILSLGRGSRLFTSTEILHAHFHRTNGLQAGAPVTMSGVTVGAVESIRFPADPAAPYVVVRIWIERSAAQRVHVDSVVRIETMGLLGDKFIDISRGTATASLASESQVLRAVDPIDYEAVLGQKSSDFFANIMEASASMRDILSAIDRGEGLLGQLVRGARTGGGGLEPSLASIQASLDHINKASGELEKIIWRINRGEGFAGALLSEKGGGRKMMKDLARSVASFRVSAERLEQLTARLNNSQGLLSRLAEDRQYADQVLGDMQKSSRDLEQILDKINSGEGTLGKLVNDPSLYNNAKGLLSSGGGWGVSVMKGLYSVTHPFSGSAGSGQGDHSQSPDSERSAPQPGQSGGSSGAGQPQAQAGSPAGQPDASATAVPR